MSYDTIQLDKSLYAVSQGFTKALESIDPTEQYHGTPLGELDAYERQLKRFGIHISGAGSDRVEKFFQNAETGVLFPEYIARAVRQGMERADVLPRITATTTRINGLDYRSIETSAGTGDPETAVDEGDPLPETKVRTKQNLIAMHKHGRLLSASYEAIRFHRLDLFTVTLRQIGAEIAKTLLADAVDVLINGDGGNGVPLIEGLVPRHDVQDVVAVRHSVTRIIYTRFGAVADGVNKSFQIEDIGCKTLAVINLG